MSKVHGSPHAHALPGAAGRLSGIDFSSNNFEGQSVAAAAANFKSDIRGQQFAFVKATEGTGYKNPYFASQWKILGNDVKSGKSTLRVAYHFLDAGSASDGVAQADTFLKTVGVHGKLPAGTRLALDWEGDALGTPAVLKAAADRIHQVTGQWPIVYTSSGTMDEAHALVPHAPKWEANYGPSYKGLDDEGGKILPSKSDTFAQYSDGRGYGKPYDMNVFNGSLADLRELAGFDGKPAHPAPANGGTTAPGGKPSHPSTGARPTGGVSAPAPKSASKKKIPFEPQVREGARGAAVRTLQTLLEKRGFDPQGVDGDFGPHTRAAVEAFQRARGLDVDGVVGRQTWAALQGGKPTQKPHGAPGATNPAGGPLSAQARRQMSALEQVAKANAEGKRPEGWCLKAVQDDLEKVGYGKIGHGDLPRFPYAHDFADYLNAGKRYQALGLKKLNITNPYDAPEGSIIVVRAGTPGTSNPVAGDIVVKGPGDHLYNDGEMGYGGPGNFPPGNDYVLGVYAPA
jgi:peptidoglycan hydrolase-like protein with peptidoglycan-binding domain/GH25 family lysozyme M1 (1,4-beta-N-acetylmuramidase)